jgi:hypothetical protein
MSLRWLFLVLFLFAVQTGAAPAGAEMSETEISKAVAEAYGVTVLRVVPSKDDGRRVYLVTVMNPGGDFNEAFQVNTIVVDAESGDKVSQFRHSESGHTLPGASTYSTDRQTPDTARKGFTWR